MVVVKWIAADIELMLRMLSFTFNVQRQFFEENTMRLLIAALLILSSAPESHAREYLEEVESEVFKTAGTPQEITKRARSCALEILEADEVAYSDNASQGLFDTRSQDLSTKASGTSVLVDVDIEGGKVIANSRRAFTAKMLKKNVKSRVAILARDQRFKIRHTKIEHLQESSGYMKNSGYTKVGKWWGSGHKDVTKQLNIVSAELADCIQNPKSEQDDDW